MCLLISGGDGRGGHGGSGCLRVIEVTSPELPFCCSCSLFDFRLRRFPLDVVGEIWNRRWSPMGERRE